MIPTALAAAPALARMREIDETSVTPGPLGFFTIFVVSVLGILLIVDMARRVRRVDYRAKVGEQVESEYRERTRATLEAEAEADAGEPSANDTPAPEGDGGPAAPSGR